MSQGLTDRIVSLSLRHRTLVLFFTLALAAVGVWCFRQTPVDAFPDVTNTKVTIITQWPGRSTEEVEKYVTIPLELAMNAVQQKSDIRSVSLFGLSVVNVVFDDHVDDFFARQQVYNLIADAELPPDAAPEVQPSYGPTGEIYRYTLRSDTRTVREMKTLQDWVIERRLRSVPGVADVVSFGGEVRTFEIGVDPHRLEHYGVSPLELFEAVGQSNINVGGDVVVTGQQACVVRGIGLINNIDEIGDIVVRTNGDVPVLVRHVADVRESCLPRLGQVGRDAEDDVVEGIVVMRKGEDPGRVIADLKVKLAELQAELDAEDVQIVPFYDREDLVDLAVGTVLKNLLSGILLVTLIVLLFMSDWRATLTVAVVIPLALLFAFICLRLRGMSANLLSLGAIDFGIIIDGAVVMVEGIFVALDRRARRVGMEAFNRLSKVGLIRGVATGKARAVFFSKLIIIVALLPVFAFQKVEGKMFSPLAFTLGFALLGALLFTLTLVPVLATLLLRRNVRERENAVVRAVRQGCGRMFAWCNAHSRLTCGVAAVVLVGGLAAFSLLGTEFLPQLNEGSIYVRATLPQSISLPEAVQVANSMRRQIGSHPEVRQVLSQTGRPNDGTDATGFYNVEFHVDIYPERSWESGITKDSLIALLGRELEAWPGVVAGFSQPITDNVEEAASGVKGSIAVKVFGQDLEVCERLSAQVDGILRRVRGIEDVGVIHSMGQPELRIELDESRLARYGIEKQTAQSIIEMAIGGRTATLLYEGERRFDIVVRYLPEYRSTADAIGAIMVPAMDGTRIPLREVASIRTISGPLQVYREGHARFGAVKFGVRGRDMGSAVAEAQRLVDAEVSLPQGYRLVWTGDFENQQRASRRLAQVVPVSILLIFLILCALFGGWLDAALVLLGVPFAAVGGIAALLLTGCNFSISAGIGFIALFGICIQNGVLMVQDIRHRLRHEPAASAIPTAVAGRVRPVVMTALMAMLGLMPAAVSRGIGSESQRPLAIVIIGGLVTATLFVLFVFPIIVGRVYAIIERKKR